MKYVIHQHADPKFNHLLGNLVELAEATLTEVKADPGELTLALVSTEKIQALNSQFRDQDQPTDVLSFSDDGADPETGRRYFGDVVIAVPIAHQQAEEANHSLETELSLLAVHGILHLLGFDHQNLSDKTAMWITQSAILEKHGMHIVQPG